MQVEHVQEWICIFWEMGKDEKLKFLNTNDMWKKINISILKFYASMVEKYNHI
jgi:hypothetical protein